MVSKKVDKFSQDDLDPQMTCSIGFSVATTRLGHVSALDYGEFTTKQGG